MLDNLFFLINSFLHEILIDKLDSLILSDWAWQISICLFWLLNYSLLLFFGVLMIKYIFNAFLRFVQRLRLDFGHSCLRRPSSLRLILISISILYVSYANDFLIWHVYNIFLVSSLFWIIFYWFASGLLVIVWPLRNYFTEWRIHLQAKLCLYWNRWLIYFFWVFIKLINLTLIWYWIVFTRITNAPRAENLNVRVALITSRCIQVHLVNKLVE